MSCTHEWRIEYVPVDECQQCRARKEEVEAFRRGAEAMREACAQWFREYDESFELTVDACHEAIADMPIPEEP